MLFAPMPSARVEPQGDLRLEADYFFHEVVEARSVGETLADLVVHGVCRIFTVPGVEGEDLPPL